ncbi:L,D-transpeptidase [Microvirga roseola]|uniref:L,D-transpeptidase n=1 Tax=Microvirga roseola TaxID=2883126 RepID=UPI001E4DF996|nr:L,D-transpeptidase [Microvirga roseola]
MLFAVLVPAAGNAQPIAMNGHYYGNTYISSEYTYPYGPTADGWNRTPRRAVRTDVRTTASLPQSYESGPAYDNSIHYAIAPQFQRQIVAYRSKEKPGTIVVDTNDKFLYLVQEGGRALRYGIGVGRPGFEWSGIKRVSMKREWPDWRPPAEMRKRRPDLPRHMEGGPENPLGARALYLGSSLYRIHGTNEPHTIGQAVSSGCIRMLNADVIDLYKRVKVGSKVVVI